MMKTFRVIFFLTLLSFVLTETFYDPSYKGNERIENVRISNVTDTSATLEWDYYGINELVIFRLITEPPLGVYNGVPHHPAASDHNPQYKYLTLKPDTEYNVTIRAEADYSEEKYVAFSEMVSFKTKPSLPVINFMLLNETDLSYTVMCLVDGTPRPEVNVTHNGKPLQFGNLDDDMIMLHMGFNLTVARYGTYTCSATNKAGTVKEDIELTYNNHHAGLLVDTVGQLLKKTDDIEKKQDMRLGEMAGAIETMKEQMQEVKQLLQAKPVVN